MKKLLFMMSSMNIGGVEKSLLSLLKSIPNDEYEVTVLILKKNGGFLEFLPKWVKVEEVDWFKSIQPILMQSPHQTVKDYIYKKQWIRMIDFIVCYMLSKYLKDRSIYYSHILRNIPKCKQYYDVAIAYPGPTEIIDCYITKKVNAKIKVQWIHFDLSKIKPNKKLYEKLFKKFDRVFVVSKEGKEKIFETYQVEKKKFKVFPNIVSNELVQKMAEEYVEFDKQYEGTKIVTVGRLSKEKGQDLAIKVLKRLRNEGYQVRWYCIGEGNAREEYEELIKCHHLENDFILVGAKSNPYPYMKQADLYVQTSRHEGFCLTLAEAKCLSKTIISTEFTGAREQLEGEKDMIIEGTEEKIYECIKAFLEQYKKVS